jgi:hypothetical protein
MTGRLPMRALIAGGHQITVIIQDESMLTVRKSDLKVVESGGLRIQPLPDILGKCPIMAKQKQGCYDEVFHKQGPFQIYSEPAENAMTSIKFTKYTQVPSGLVFIRYAKEQLCFFYVHDVSGRMH